MALAGYQNIVDRSLVAHKKVIAHIYVLHINSTINKLQTLLGRQSWCRISSRKAGAIGLAELNNICTKGCEIEAMDKVAENLEDVVRQHVLTACTDMLINLEGLVNRDLETQLKMGTGPQLVLRKELKRGGQNILRMC